ncbi:hypothetical protein [Streptomyces sp. URMC 124]|uniref:hypothetical protein n=1 Tax=Streptomyces sp. URMC 124 TaxID=3423405 RepID=UPI003F1C7EE8
MSTRVVREGLLAGAAGVAVMTLAEKAEQRCVGRPGSDAPGRVLLRLAGRDGTAAHANRIMHYGQGVALGVLRSAMAAPGCAARCPPYSSP